MVLEEEIWFSSEEEAQECARIFKKLNVSAHIRTKIDLESRVMYKAPYSVLKGVIDEEITRLRESGEESEDDPITELQDVLDDLTQERDLLAECFATHQPGDHISTSVFNLLIKDGTLPETKEEMDVLLNEATVTRLLELNKLIDIDEGGVVLARTISPDDAILSIFGDDIPPLREDSLQQGGIFRSLESRDSPSYFVTTGPDVVFLEDLTALEEFFEKTENDDESDSFFVNLQVKQVLVAEILGLVKKDGRASKDEIITDFIHREIPIEDEKITIGLHLSPGYVDAILNDLKKIGILKGKDSKLKIVM